MDFHFSVAPKHEKPLKSGRGKATGLLHEWTTLNGAFQEAPFLVGFVGVFFMPLGRKDVTLSVETSLHTGFFAVSPPQWLHYDLSSSVFYST